MEDFEGFAPGSEDLSLCFDGDCTARLEGDGYVSGAWDGHSLEQGRFSTSAKGDRFFEVRAHSNMEQTEAAIFRLDFTVPQAGFGFFATDFENSRTLLRFETPAGRTREVQLPYTRPSPSGSAFFYGILDPDYLFTRVTFIGLNEQQRDWFGFDDFTIATAEQIIPAHSPEPGTLMLLATGLLLAFCKLRC